MTSLIKGTDLNDYLDGTTAAETLQGLGGDDTLYGFQGNDLLEGGAGQDELRVYVGNVTLDGGEGSDLVNYAISTEPITVDLRKTCQQRVTRNSRQVLRNIENVFGTGANDKITGSDGVNNISGGYGNDTIKGMGGSDYLYGGNGNDKIYGGIGSDVIYGDEGNDRLFGNEDPDILLGGDGDDYIDGGKGYGNQLTGGAGKDTFVLYKQDFLGDGVFDYGLITDFEKGSDKIVIKGVTKFTDLVIAPRNNGDGTTVVADRLGIPLSFVDGVGLDPVALDESDFIFVRG